MICYIFKVFVDELKALVIHYKIIHSLRLNSTFTFCENACFQSFNCLSVFKKLITKKHVSTATNFVSSSSPNSLPHITNNDDFVVNSEYEENYILIVIHILQSYI